MKMSINIIATVLLLSSGLFAPISPKSNSTQPKKDMITFTTLASKKGIQVNFKKGTPGEAVVIIYDNDKNVLRKDVLSDSKSLEKGYILTKLDNGDYTVEVTFNKIVMKKAIHVYNEGATKMFLIKS